jgi:acetate kinase
MPRGTGRVALVLNVGSSSVKFALFRRVGPRTGRLKRELTGRISRIGTHRSTFRAFGSGGKLRTPRRVDYRDVPRAVDAALEWLAERPGAPAVDVLGHRIVHGGLRYRRPMEITPTVLRQLSRMVPLDPDHMPGELRSVRSSIRLHPRSVHVACFDTSFHRRMLPPAQIYALPNSLTRRGIVRYGFHGLSFESIVRTLRESPGANRSRRLIVAHLGSGSSLCAIRDGRSLDTTMGFSPTGGLVMGTRSGDLDPSVVLFLAEERHFSTDRLRRLFNQESGMLAVSGRSPDMEELLRRSRPGNSACRAIDLFCYQVEKHVAGLTVPLGGLDTFVFTGGIGENAPRVRAQICQGLSHLGLRLDAPRNRRNERVISTSASTVRVLVIPTDEEYEIARAAFKVYDSVRRTGE